MGFGARKTGGRWAHSPRAGTAALTATVPGGICVGKTILYGILVATIAIPGMVTVGPVFLAYKDFIPVAVLTLFSYFKAILKELDEAAAMDGYSLLDTMFRIIFPVTMPGCAVTFLLLFIAAGTTFCSPPRQPSRRMPDF